MSLPRMCAMPTNSDIEKEKQRLAAAAMFPGLQFMGFPTATTTSSVFPQNMAAQLSLFNPHLQQYYANFMHQQQMLQSLQNHSPQSRMDLSPSVSGTSSHNESPARKLQLDEEGNPVCLLCDEKLSNEQEWAEHIEMERAKLMRNINGIKEQKSEAMQRTLSSPSTDQSKRKREYELLRIRANQHKRLGMKNPVVVRDPMGVPLNSDSPSCSRSATVFIKREDPDASLEDKTFCKSCERHHDYLIISNSFDQPRCQECFMKLRAQTSVLPLTITSSPMESSSPGASSEGGVAEKASPQSPLSLVVESKRSKIE